MHKPWSKPDFQQIRVNGECTAYSGTSDVPGDHVQPLQEQERGRGDRRREEGAVPLRLTPEPG